MANTFFSCPVDCDTATTNPVLPENLCVTARPFSQVTHLFILPYVAGVLADSPFSLSGETVTLVSDNLDNGDADLAKVLLCNGGIEAPAETVQDVENRKQVVTNRLHTLEVQINIKDKLLYDFARNCQCGTLFNFFYQDAGGFLYGDSDLEVGIVPTSVSAAFNQTGGREDVTFATIRIVFESLTNPDRFVSPFLG
jgi:hypothetical protein